MRQSTRQPTYASKGEPESELPQIESIRKKRRSFRIEVARMLASSQNTGAVRFLLEMLYDKSWDVREEALIAINQLDRPSGHVAARAALGDPDWPVRSTAAELLEEYADPNDTYALINALKDRRWMVRASAAAALGHIGDARSLRAVYGALRDRYPGVRRYAAVSLADAGHREASPLLEKRLSEDTAKSARIGYLSALYLLGQSERLNELIELLHDPSYVVRHQALVVFDSDVRLEDTDKALHALDDLLQRETDRGVKADAERVRAELIARHQDSQLAIGSLDRIS